MISDSPGTRPAGTAGTVAADVAIVGAGPAGLTIAEALAGEGHDVVILEAGARTHRPQDDEAMRGTGVGHPVELVRSRQRGFGGTSIHWQPDTGLRLRRMDEADLAPRPARNGIGWPIGSAELEPYFERALGDLGLPGSCTPADWYGADSPTAIAWPGGPELAMFRIAEHDSYVTRYDRVHASDRITVLLETPCTGIVQEPEDPRRIAHLTARTPDGTTLRVEARRYVLATGGIDNARLLLASPGATGAGVGNETDNVGRWFMDHFAIDTGVLVPTGDFDADLFTIRRDGPLSSYQPMLWLGEEQLERHDLLNAVAWVKEVHPQYLSAGVGGARRIKSRRHPSPRTPLAEPLKDVLRDAPSLARFGLDRVLKRERPPVLSLRYFTEQVPDRDSRVTLAAERDPHGIPRAQVDWRVADDDLRMIRRHQDVLSGLLEERGVGRIEDRFDPDDYHRPIMAMYHHIGTTRMDADPAKGVVDATCRVHTVDNLYVAGSSVFATGGYVNPTLTILALAHRLADQLTSDLRAPTLAS